MEYVVGNPAGNSVRNVLENAVGNSVRNPEEIL